MTMESSFPTPYSDSEVIRPQRSEQDILDAAYLRTIASQLCFNTDMQPVRQVARTSFIHRTETAERTVSENPGGLALWIAVSGINAVAAWRHASSDHKNNCFQTSAEEWHADHVSGFQPAVDLGFSIYFPACVANAVVEERFLSEVSQSGLTLSDWADLIGQGWFAKLTNTLAFGPPNLYTTLGLTAPDYAPGALKQALNDRLKLELPNLFEASKKPRPSDQEQLPIPAINVVTALRETLHERRREGHICPGALKSMVISEELAKDDHVRFFLEAAKMEFQPAVDTAHPRYKLVSSTITQTLQALAQALRDYDRQFGTPAVSLSSLHEASYDRKPAVSHTKQKPLGLFAREKEQL